MYSFKTSKRKFNYKKKGKRFLKKKQKEMATENIKQG